MTNFFSVGKSPIEIKLDSHKRTLVIGKNGSGKSMTILDSVIFALYGKPFRKTNKPNIVNSINKNNLLVELDFSIGKRDYKIIRGLKPTIFEIYCNGVLINQDASSKDYQDYLEKYILKVNYKSFVNVVILGSARYNPFMSLSASEKRTIIEELLDIQIFSTMNVLVKDKISKLKEDILKNEYNMELTKEKIKIQKDNIEEHKKSTNEQIQLRKKEIDKSNLQIESYQKDIILIQKHINVLQNKISDRLSVEQKRNKIISIESRIKTNLSKIEKDIEFYKNNDNCPTCKQSIQDSHKNIEIESNEMKFNEMQIGLDKVSENLTSLDSKLMEIKEISDKVISHNSEIVRINASISAIKEYVKKEIKQLERISDEFQNIEDKHYGLNVLVKELNNLESIKKELMETKKYYDYSIVLLKDGGIKTRIVKQYLPVMNKLINTYLSKMNFFVNFNINENFEEVIKSRYRDEFKYENFSEGEKTKIDLSLLFAFRQIAKMKNSVNTNLLIMDEILDSALDLEGTDQFLELIETLDNSNIFIISHRGDQISDKFDRTLKFDKKKNFTKMQELI